ncbi:hypothetical protein E2C06_34470 [Dankookia rubra]|uniref:Uncharacterized protein n=1 Tax=Dankookia rubra TaxID=1442381 RepID=A0A4R5Q5A0_9PROT|nr:hypothetical protein [Dankookia rubra]TDH58080.1 hypothetical protein E2C06_34470 [Dankookia rubra]
MRWSFAALGDSEGLCDDAIGRGNGNMALVRQRPFSEWRASVLIGSMCASKAGGSGLFDLQRDALLAADEARVRQQHV